MTQRLCVARNKNSLKRERRHVQLDVTRNQEYADGSVRDTASFGFPVFASGLIVIVFC
jgi:hypothetical protein